MKRSHAVSLVLLGGAGALAFGLAHHDSSQKEEDALIYRSEQECVDARVRTAADCHRGFEMARSSHRTSAPRYFSLSDCERHHGRGGCADGTSIDPAASGYFVPAMMAYLIGRTPEQALPPQPLYRHAEDQRDDQRGWSGSSAGYCTGAGGRVWATRSGSGSTRVASSVARTQTPTPRVVARGGFGFTGHATSGRFFSSGG